MKERNGCKMSEKHKKGIKTERKWKEKRKRKGIKCKGKTKERKYKLNYKGKMQRKDWKNFKKLKKTKSKDIKWNEEWKQNEGREMND